MTRRSVTIALVASLVAAAATAAALPARRGLLRSEARSDLNTPRVRVQILNATKTRGLGRRAMLYLRDQGFDVVEVGTTSTLLDTTLVLDRSRHPEWAKNIATSLGTARVETRPDSSRYLDVTVLVGATWRPPPQPFYP